MFDLLGSFAFWSSSVTGATPIAFAALGALFASRSGSLFVGVEGTLLGSSFVALAVTAQSGSTWLGVLTGVVAGAALGAANGLLSMQLRMGDVVAGLILQIVVLGGTGLLVARWFPDGLAAGAHQMGPAWQGTGMVPIDVVVRQPVLVYGTVLVAVAMTVFFRTRLGLVVRASGDSLRVAYTLRIRVARVRYLALTVDGAVTGLGGAFLGLAVAGVFTTTITSGRGFVALACVILAAWRPVLAVVAALGFSVAYTFGFQTDDPSLAALQVLPYVLTIVVIGFLKSGRGPADEGRGLLVDGR
jgi:general nucleoside transport system permease protein